MTLLVQLLQGLLVLLLLQSILTTEDEKNSLTLPICYMPKDKAQAVSPPSEQIINGDVVEKGTAPWMVSIALINRLMHKCGGVLLDYDWVLTVAHCVEGSRPSTLAVIGGEYSFAEVEGTEQIRQVSHVFVHPKYDWYTKQNDIALINTKRRFYPTEGGPGPIPFYAHPSSFTGETCQIYGWGSLNEGGDIDARLRKSNQTILNEQSCKVVLPGFIYDDMFCGSNDGGSGPCMGDWGGPLVCRDGELAGIASWSVGCADTNFPTVYENASYFYPWIHDIMNRFSINLRIDELINDAEDLENSVNPEIILESLDHD